MASNKQISVKICGNPESNSGFMILLLFNSPSFQIDDVLYSGFDVNSFYFTIKIEADKVVYKLIKNKVRSYGAFREGSLVIGFSIPRGYKLDGGYSPYDVLIALKDSFISSCMTCKDPVADVYEYKKGPISPDILNSTIEKFTISPAIAPYRPMTIGGQKAYMTASLADIRLLMNDVHYSAFSAYGEIILATDAQSPNYAQITNLPIPRVREYSIVKDGIKDGFVRSSSEKIFITGNKDSRYYENNSIEFSIDDIRSGKCIPGIAVDDVNELIHINTEGLSTPRVRKINITFNNKDVERYFFTHIKGVTLYHRGKQLIIDHKFAFTVSGEDIAILEDKNGFELIISKTDKYRITSTAFDGNELKVVAEEIKTEPIRPIVVPVPEPVKEPRLTISFNKEHYEKYTQKGKLAIKVINSNDNTRILTNILLKVEQQRRLYTAVVNDIPASWYKQSFRVKFEDEKKYYETDDLYFGKKDELQLKYTDFLVRSKGFWKVRVRPYLTIISFVLGLLLGGFACYFFIDGFKEEPETLFKCEHCEFITYSKSELQEHNSKKHREYKCATCGKIFKSTEERQNHNVENHSSTPSPEGDGGENAESDTISPDSIHLEEDKKTFDCDECEAKYTDEAGLTSHKKKHHKKFNCNVAGCNKQFKNNQELMNHKMTDHPVFICEKCYFWFNSKDELKNHYRHKHSDR